ncbi:hypothetical protein M9H77_35035 [Catharanthus roseus]|uniref:Uncharacterized protein n=1 Tax=Catharanthus roseus TaxID=4058 RepID=A0ACB9ZRI1_CATRO|nr:hypothetical protein M9H77_35035 [Catharanthus roseus]
MPSDQFIWLHYLDRALVTSNMWQLRGNDHTFWGTQHTSHVKAWYQWRLRVRDGPALAAEVLSYPSDEYIRWYWGITRVYIGNPANRDTCSHGYQPAEMDKRMMVHGRVREESVDNYLEVHGLYLRYFGLHSITARYSADEHVPDRSARGVKRGARRQPDCGAGDGRPPVPPFPDRHEHVDPGHVEVERGEGSGRGQPTIDPFDRPNLDIPSFSLGLTQPSQSLSSGSGILQMPPPPILGFAPFQSPQSTYFEFFGFRASPPPGIANSSTPHQPIS